MRPWVCVPFLLGAMLGICRAEAIHLKNGTSITADRVIEKDGQVEYTVGGTHYSIPKSSVSSIEQGTTIGISMGTSKSGLIPPPADAGSSLPSVSGSHQDLAPRACRGPASGSATARRGRRRSLLPGCELQPGQRTSAVRH